MRNLNQELAKLYPNDYAKINSILKPFPTEFHKLNTVGFFGSSGLSLDNWDAVWGKDSDKKIEDGTTYANVTEGDAKYPTGNTAKIRLNPTTDVIDFLNNVNSNDLILYRDFGSALSDTAWVMRTKITLSDVTSAGANAGFETMWGMSSNTNVPSGLADGLYLEVQNRVAGTDFVATSFLNKAREGGTSSESFFTTADPSATSFYAQQIRESATSFSVDLMNSDYSSSTEKETLTVGSGVGGLRYWSLIVFTQTPNSGNIDGSVDDLRLADGVTTPP